MGILNNSKKIEKFSWGFPVPDTFKCYTDNPGYLKNIIDYKIYLRDIVEFNNLIRRLSRTCKSDIKFNDLSDEKFMTRRHLCDYQ